MATVPGPRRGRPLPRPGAPAEEPPREDEPEEVPPWEKPQEDPRYPLVPVGR